MADLESLVYALWTSCWLLISHFRVGNITCKNMQAYFKAVQMLILFILALKTEP